MSPSMADIRAGKCPCFFTVDGDVLMAVVHFEGLCECSVYLNYCLMNLGED